jgi:hypothetical protein
MFVFFPTIKVISPSDHFCDIQFEPFIGLFEHFEAIVEPHELLKMDRAQEKKSISLSFPFN